MASANYNGKQSNNTAYIKTFTYGIPVNLWKTMRYLPNVGPQVSVITPSSSNVESLYIKGDIFVDGSVISPSDVNIKNNISTLDIQTVNKLMNLRPTSFTLKNDNTNHIHYGFIAQELENEYPELIENKPDKRYSKIKGVNYLEIIPLLVNKIQMMQKEIDDLKEKIKI